MPIGGHCLHPSCPTGNCRKLTEIELTPTEDDLLFAKKLIDEDWRQTSNKYRGVAKLNNPLRDWRDLVRPEHHVLVEQATSPGTCYAGDDVFRSWCYCAWQNPAWVERRTLTVKQFAAFRKLEGKLGGSYR